MNLVGKLLHPRTNGVMIWVNNPSNHIRINQDDPVVCIGRSLYDSNIMQVMYFDQVYTTLVKWFVPQE